MKLYLAGGFTISNIKGREREMSQMFTPWRRLYSFYYLILIHKSEILNIVKDANKQKRFTRSTRNSEARIG